MKPREATGNRLVLLIISGLAFLMTSCGYLQVNPPPDVKADPVTQEKVAWLAAASNMLAAAGYGYGIDVQNRAENIFSQLLENFGTRHEGWTDAAMQWWLSSEYNEWPENPYKQVRVIGNKKPARPWTDPEGSTKIANLLRDGNIISVSLGWLSQDRSGESAEGHVLNCWGDDRGEKKHNHLLPSHLRVTDCFRNKGGIIQTYKYDNFNRIFPDGSNGTGWFIAYDDEHPFIMNVILLSKVDDPQAGNSALVTRLDIGMDYNRDERTNAMSLKYGHDLPVLSYIGGILLESGKELTGSITSPLNGNPFIMTEWSFGKSGLEKGKKISIVMESSAPMNIFSGLESATITDGSSRDSTWVPELNFRITAPQLAQRYHSAGACGGYFILSLAFQRADSSSQAVPRSFEALIFKQYPGDINPERPTLQVTAPTGYILNTVKAGQSYGYLETSQLYDFSGWMVNMAVDHAFSGDTLHLPVNLIGLLPFPEAKSYPDFSH